MADNMNATTNTADVSSAAQNAINANPYTSSAAAPTEATPTTATTPTTDTTAPTLPTFKAEGTLQMTSPTSTSPENVYTYQGKSYAPVSQLAQSLGSDYSIDPITGQVKIGGKTFSAIGRDTQGNPMVGVRNVAEGLGYNVGYDNASKMVNISKPPEQLPTTDQLMQTYGTQYLTGNESIAQYTPSTEQQGYEQNLSSMVQQVKPIDLKYEDFYNQEKALQDPLYSRKISQLISQFQPSIDKMNEIMNSRGLYNSGIAQAAYNDLAAKTSQTVANVAVQEAVAIEKAARQAYSTALKNAIQGNQNAIKTNMQILDKLSQSRKNDFNQWLNSQNLDLNRKKYARDSFEKFIDYSIKKDEMQYKQMIDAIQIKQKQADITGYYIDENGQPHETLDRQKLIQQIASATAAANNKVASMQNGNLKFQTQNTIGAIGKNLSTLNSMIGKEYYDEKGNAKKITLNDLSNVEDPDYEYDDGTPIYLTYGEAIARNLAELNNLGTLYTSDSSEEEE